MLTNWPTMIFQFLTKKKKKKIYSQKNHKLNHRITIIYWSELGKSLFSDLEQGITDHSLSFVLQLLSLAEFHPQNVMYCVMFTVPCCICNFQPHTSVFNKSPLPYKLFVWANQNVANFFSNLPALQIETRSLVLFNRQCCYQFHHGCPSISL